MNKQIEEMAKALGIAFQLAGTTRFGEVAEVLVNAGYRKESEVATEIISDIEQAIFAHGTKYALKRLEEIKKKYGVVADEDRVSD